MNRKVDVKAVEGFVGAKQDVGAHAGIMVSALGFTKGAQCVAERNQISLYTYRDTQEETWPNGLKVPVVLEVWHIQPLALYVKDESGMRKDLPSDSEVQLHDVNSGKEMAMATWCKSIWNNHMPKTEGDFLWEFVCNQKAEGNQQMLLGVGFSTTFSRTLREGLLHFQGLVDSTKHEAHMPSFMITAQGAPRILPAATNIFDDQHAGFGILISTTLVKTANKTSVMVNNMLLHGPLSIAAQRKGSFSIRLAKSDLPRTVVTDS